MIPRLLATVRFIASGTFWLYGVISLFGFVFIMKKLLETKGKSFEEIERVYKVKIVCVNKVVFNPCFK